MSFQSGEIGLANRFSRQLAIQSQLTQLSPDFDMRTASHLGFSPSRNIVAISQEQFNSMTQQQQQSLSPIQNNPTSSQPSSSPGNLSSSCSNDDTLQLLTSKVQSLTDRVVKCEVVGSSKDQDLMEEVRNVQKSLWLLEKDIKEKVVSLDEKYSKLEELIRSLVEETKKKNETQLFPEEQKPIRSVFMPPLVCLNSRIMIAHFLFSQNL
jgi:hypothetical protein